MSAVSQKRFTKKEKSWILYDWANSVYATNIMAAIFPTIFVSIAGDLGDIWWGYGTSIATFIIALMAPFLGSIADYKGMKKKLFTGFMLLGVIATALIAMTNNWRFMLVAYVLSKIGFSGSNLFYDSFLTDVTTDERMDKVSTWGYAMGYIGGSTIPFVISIAVLMMMGYSNPIAQKFSILITSVWWFLFTIPFLKNVEQVHYIEKPDKISFKNALVSVLNTAKDIAKSRGMLLFIIAYFFYIDGVGTVISISTAYGTALGLGATGMILALLVTQIVAMPCSILFGKLTKKISARKALLIAITVYMFICLVGFYMGFSLEPHQEKYRQVFNDSKGAWEAKLDNYTFENREGAENALSNYLNSAQVALRAKDPQAFEKLEIHYPEGSQTEQNQLALIQSMLKPELLAFKENNKEIIDNFQGAIAFSTILFWAMAVLVGTVQGGIQAVSRSYFGKLVPKKRSNEYFGFFDIFGKFATVVGPLLYSLVGGITKRSSYGTLVLMLLFLIGFLILLFAKKPLEELEEQRLAQKALSE
ncbi:MAG: MFS transporter [Bacillota bacterium]|nr:MFS transporter [Bacillota bacterium]